MERTEKIGLGIATAGHVLLFGVLSAGFLSSPNPLKLNSPPMDVSLVDDVALQSAAPQISRDPPPPSVAPEVGDTAEPAPSVAAPSEPEVAPPPPTPKPVAKPVPAAKPVERARPKPPALKPPTPKPAAAKPKPAKATPPVEKAKPAPSKPTTKPTPTPAKPAATTGKGKTDKPRGSLLGKDFLKGIESETTAPRNAAPAASVVGAKQKSALDAEIRRQLKPHWKAPTGADSEQLRTIVAVELSPSGGIVGTPEAVDTTGITASNRAQVKLHQELAVKAIRLAAPFKLPPDLYDGWKSLRITFDKRLSQ